MTPSGVVRIGTSGIVVPGPKTTFPDEHKAGSRLSYYGSLFNTLEINSSFYKVPLPTTVARWATEVPDDFRFTVKLWREITHVKKLLYKESDIDYFMLSANSLGVKRGCLLIQFPASITIEFIDVVEDIIRHLHHVNVDQAWHLVVEFRHKGWYTARMYAMLQKYNASIVLHDMEKSAPSQTDTPASIVYLRFHGPEGDYKGSYTNDFLIKTAASITNWVAQGKEVYAYFNNTMGDAFQNAQVLRQLLSQVKL